MFAETEPNGRSLHSSVRVGLVSMLFQSLFASFVILEMLPPLLIKLVCQYNRSASNWSARSPAAKVRKETNPIVQERIVFVRQNGGYPDALVVLKNENMFMFMLSRRQDFCKMFPWRFHRIAHRCIHVTLQRGDA